uniref:Uncharacterized protein n=1 Tax=Aegilops tauschii subsp. strangulata TaxID=200361 RepID=A0A453A8J4_AEGTS
TTETILLAETETTSSARPLEPKESVQEIEEWRQKGEKMSLLLVLISVVVGMVGLLLRWNEVRYGRRGNVRLPPGTMGWPLFGETTEFLKEGPS